MLARLVVPLCLLAALLVLDQWLKRRAATPREHAPHPLVRPRLRLARVRRLVPSRPRRGPRTFTRRRPQERMSSRG